MKKHIPNLVTCLNLMCGVCACILALWGYFYQAYCCILAGAACDLCDGALARMLRVTSPMGKELDSLSDLVSFGLAPALMMFTWLFKLNYGGVSHPLAFVPLLMVPFAAIRLARFNVGESQSHHFNGLPTPAAAMIAASMIAYGHTCAIAGADSAILNMLKGGWAIPVVSSALCLLMVSRIKMFSVKGKIGVKHYILAGGALALVAGIAAIAPRGLILAGYLALFTLLLFTAYILLAVVGRDGQE